jgi:hypothetical protein
MFEKENHFGKEKGKDCCCIRRQVLYRAPDRHLRQLDPPQKKREVVFTPFYISNADLLYVI